MQFGVTLPNFPYGAAPSRDHLLEVARVAEEQGYTSLWTSDHILVGSEFPRYGHIYEALVTLAWLAAKTETIRLGTSVLVVPMRNAILTAKQVATIDELSGGRFILGAGIGWNEEEYGFLGAKFKKRGEVMNESLAVIRDLWTAEKPSFSGQFHRYENALFEPKPEQKGGPPIWVGGNSDRALGRAARLGDGWHADEVDPAGFAEASRKVERYASEHGRSVGVSIRYTVDLFAATGNKKEQAVSEGYYLGNQGEVGMRGSLEEMIDFVRKYRDMGATDFICQFEHDSVEQHLDFIRTFRREVADQI